MKAKTPVPLPHPKLEPPIFAFEVEEAAELLHCGRTTMFELIKEWGIKTVTVGRKRLITPWELERVLREQEQADDIGAPTLHPRGRASLAIGSNHEQ